MCNEGSKTLWNSSFDVNGSRPKLFKLVNH